jgi:hypothetical protein
LTFWALGLGLNMRTHLRLEIDGWC